MWPPPRGTKIAAVRLLGCGPLWAETACADALGKPSPKYHSDEGPGSPVGFRGLPGEGLLRRPRRKAARRRLISSRASGQQPAGDGEGTPAAPEEPRPGR